MFKMRAVIELLVLLLSMCGSQTRSTQSEVHTESQSTGAAAAAAVSTQLDVSAELRELRDMVVELRVTLRFTQDDLKNTKDLLYKIEVENDAVKQRLEASETEVEKLKMEQAAQDSELTAMKTRLAATETEVVNLEKEITEKPKVAFSAGLTDSGFIEAGNTDLNLVFTKTITNVGQAYSNMTGFFTAPVKGVYYFRFTVTDYSYVRWITIRMVKNGEQVMYLEKFNDDGRRSYLSSGATLQLEVGDVVNMRLPRGYWLHGDSHNHCIFSGFLLFVL